MSTHLERIQILWLPEYILSYLLRDMNAACSKEAACYYCINISYINHLKIMIVISDNYGDIAKKSLNIRQIGN